MNNDIHDAPTEELVMRREEVIALRRAYQEVTADRKRLLMVVQSMKERIYEVEQRLREMLEMLG